MSKHKVRILIWASINPIFNVCPYVWLNTLMISGYLGNSIDEAIATFAMNYSDQNEREHRAFIKVVSAGKIEVYHEK